MAWYRTGTVSVTNGSTAVTGSGTNFVAGAQVGEGFAAPDGRLYEIVTIVSATSLTIGKAYLGSTQTGQTYEIVPTQSLVADLAGQVSTLISDFQSVADEAGEGKFDYGTAASPGITFTLDQDTGFFHDTNNEIGVAAGGTKVAEFNSGGLTVTGNVTAATADINGGTIDGVTIGGASAGAGTFTSITGTSLDLNGAIEVSGGIYVGGTAAANLLDDYEEGTWTPVPQDSSGNSGTATTASGYYTKVGNLVYLNFLLENIDTTGLTAGQDLRITGLPFPTKSLVGSQFYLGNLRMVNVAFEGDIGLGILDNTDYIRIVETITGAGGDFTVVSDVTSGTADIYGTIMYMA